MNKFWKWKKQKVINQDGGKGVERVLELRGTIASESWYDDDITPKMFKDELLSGSGDITVYINSPGGDCVAAAQIYNMLSEYPGKVTVKIDAIAASAASVIAMSGDTVLMSPASMMMIHNPATIAFGDHNEMQKAIDMLAEVKESIINAYQLKTGLSRAKLSKLMEAETWMSAHKAVELGFADDIFRKKKDNDSEEDEHEEKPDENKEENTPDEGEDEEEQKNASSFLFSRKAVNASLMNKLTKVNLLYGVMRPLIRYCLTLISSMLLSKSRRSFFTITLSVWRITSLPSSVRLSQTLKRMLSLTATAEESRQVFLQQRAAV